MVEHKDMTTHVDKDILMERISNLVDSNLPVADKLVTIIEHDTEFLDRVYTFGNLIFEDIVLKVPEILGF